MAANDATLDFQTPAKKMPTWHRRYNRNQTEQTGTTDVVRTPYVGNITNVTILEKEHSNRYTSWNNVEQLKQTVGKQK